MKILVLNSGSSSLKYRLFDMTNASFMAGGVFERINAGRGTWLHISSAGGREISETLNLEIANHEAGIRLATERLTDPNWVCS